MYASLELTTWNIQVASGSAHYNSSTISRDRASSSVDDVRAHGTTKDVVSGRLAKKFREARKAAGLPASVVLYVARHSYGTFVYEATKNLQLVMDSMGHGDVRTTMRYQHHDHLDPVRIVINQRNLERHNSRHSPRVVQ